MLPLVAEIEAERGPNGYDQLQPFEAVRSAVHGAGGVLLLAHVAQVLRGQPEAQIALVEAALADGADGFELWHPHNLAEPHFERLEATAQRLGCLVSGGSDCHDALSATGSKALGSVPVPESAMDAIENAR